MTPIRNPYNLPTAVRALIILLGLIGQLLSSFPAYAAPECRNVVSAEVVALEQVYFYNRFGAFNPAGMMYALRRDVVEDLEDTEAFSAKPPALPEVEKALAPYDPDNRQRDLQLAGHVKLRSDKRPRPLVLRVNAGDCLKVTFTNLLSPGLDGQEVYQRDPSTGLFPIDGNWIDIKDPHQPPVMVLDGEEPATRHADMQVNGLDYAYLEAGDPSTTTVSTIANLGQNPPPSSQTPATGANVCSSDVKDFGSDRCILAAPGETRIYVWHAEQEGTYLLQSMGGPGGGEGDGGQVGLGLFGAVNVEPAGATWYRSQVTAAELQAAQIGRTPSPYGQPILDYTARFKKGHHDGEPVLDMLKCKDQDAHKDCEIIYTDLNAVVEYPLLHETTHVETETCSEQGPGSSCSKTRFREFTVIFHDELTAQQAFRELADEGEALNRLKDGFGINYGSGGLGAMLLANRAKVGPAAGCAECKLEEFFLSSWANGDPAMVLGARLDKEGKAVMRRDKSGKLQAVLEAKYPDDPSNVHHSYLGDPVRFRNLHAGPKETHIFHLHAHQWVRDKHDPNSVYLDSQTISPGATFDYDVHYGGSGNRNLGPGDSIFHCHLYPHFAQGMWELWRTHDVYEAGTRDRYLPDGEIAEGTPTPAIVPLPHSALPPMPTQKFKGYPFYIAGQKGHRPPQAPFDIEAKPDPTTLQRHVIVQSEAKARTTIAEEMGQPLCDKPTHKEDKLTLFSTGRKNAACIAAKVHARNDHPNFLGLARELDKADIRMLPAEGTPAERTAMDFHQGKLDVHGSASVPVATDYDFNARAYPTCNTEGQCDSSDQRVLFAVNGRAPQPGAPFADPCPDTFHDASGQSHTVETRNYRAAYLQLDLQVNKAGWHDPQGRIAVLENDIKDTLSGDRPTQPLFFRARSGECIQFKTTNLIPSNLNLDDFQVFSPTDVIGQHIHLVKFDVTSSDGSGNGWNYEDGTLAADEVRERIKAYNRFGKHKPLHPKTHPLFLSGALQGESRGYCGDQRGGSDDDWVNHPWCGAQTTIQRWWADPLLNGQPGEKGVTDRTIRTVFTHDHFGPSSHQHHGMYAALLVEPTNSKWTDLSGQHLMGGVDAKGKPAVLRPDGGPTSYAANVIVYKESEHAPCVLPESHPDCAPILDAGKHDPELTGREFALAFADFAIVYDKGNRPVNPPNRLEHSLPNPSIAGPVPMPEAISASDPGTQLINYRNEPIPLRIGEEDTNDAVTQYRLKADDERHTNDLAHVFSSAVHGYQDPDPKKLKKERRPKFFTEPLSQLRQPGDPATPLLTAYAGDRVQLRLIQGAQEENHMFNIQGLSWLSQPQSPNSGYSNGQPIGISEHFEFNLKVESDEPRTDTDYLYSSWATDNLWDGQWGLLRSYGWGQQQRGLQRLPNNPLRTGALPKSAFTCPVNAPLRDIHIKVGLARDLLIAKGEKSDKTPTLQYNRAANLSDPNAIMFVRTQESYTSHHPQTNKPLKTPVCDQVTEGNCWNRDNPEPLILRAKANDCIHVTLENELPATMPDTPPKDKQGHYLTDPGSFALATDPQVTDRYIKSWSYNTLPPITPGLNFNQVPSSSRVGLYPQLLATNMRTGAGGHIGRNDDATVGARQTSTNDVYWYAGKRLLEDGKPQEYPIEFGVVGLMDMGDVIKHSSHGAVGALVVEPQDAIIDHSRPGCGPDYGRAPDGKPNDGSLASATICYEETTKQPFREFVVVYQDDVSMQRHGRPVPNLRNADDAEDTGQKAFNYRSEPIWARLGADPGAEPDSMLELDWSNAFSSFVRHPGCKTDAAHPYCDPATPLFTAQAGQAVRFRVVHPQGKPRNHAFTLSGHHWITAPWECGSTSDPTGHANDSCNSTKQGWNKFSPTTVGTVNGIGPSRHVNILTKAGGDFAVPGDYMYRTQEGFQFGGGLWGIFCVYDETDPSRCEHRGAALTDATGHTQAN